MIELVRDVWGLLVTLLVSCWDIIQSALSVVIVEDPFWRGVECTIIALILWKNRRAIIETIDGIPLLGGLLARGLIIVNDVSEFVLDTGLSLWNLVVDNTWGRLVKLVKRADEDLRG